MTKLYSITLFFLLFISNNSQGQRLVEIIKQAEKAVLTVSSHTQSGNILAEAKGFFISSDGIAIIPANLFFNSDSILVQTQNGRKFGLQRLLQVHHQANLAMVKVDVPRTREFNYLIPSKQSSKENQDVLIFGHLEELEEGMAIKRITNIKYQVYLNRLSVIDAKLSDRSFGAPAVDSRGELTGIITAYNIDSEPFSLSPNIINDSNWVNINIPTHRIKHYPALKTSFNRSLNEGLYYLTVGDNEKAARSFSNYLKLVKDNAALFALRGHARYQYKNTYGCKEDLALSKRMDDTGYLPYYYEAMHLLNDNKKEEAFLNFSLCIEKQPNFSYALVERGKLRYELKKNLQEAYSDFNTSTQIDTTYGAGFYEKARFILRHFEEKSEAEHAINKAIDLDPNLPGVYSIRGLMRISAENYLAAIQDLEIAVKKDAHDVHALFNKGVAEYNLGMKEKACSDWERAGNLGHYKSIKYLSRFCAGSNRKY